MPSNNNLRIIYENLVDLSTTTFLSTSTTASGTSTANLKQDTKNLVWRGSNGTRASIILNFGTNKQVGGVVLAFSNLVSSNATIKVAGYLHPNVPSISGSALSTSVISAYTTSPVECCPWNNLALTDWGTNPVGSSNYNYGGGTYARAWLNESQRLTPVRYLGIEIYDPSATYIEISRLIVGNYWSPKYNTGYGISAGIKDLSEHVRTENGDLLTRRGPRFKTLNFDLQWLDTSDRKEITRIFLGNGASKPLFVSLFPDSSGTDEDFQREGIHQIYGKMVQIPGVSYTSYEIYSTNIEIEEV
ncbi:MAG: hypothetical protein ACO3UU_03010 [Minisyncoccia bacterium]